MYKIHLQIAVKGTIEKDLQFECKSIIKDVVKEKIYSQTQLSIDQFDVIYYDSENDAITLSSESDYVFAQHEAFKLRKMLEIFANTEKQIQWGKQVDQRNFVNKQMIKYVVADKKDKFKKVCPVAEELNQVLQLKQIQGLIPKISRKQKKRMKKTLKKQVKDQQLRILRRESAKRQEKEDNSGEQQIKLLNDKEGQSIQQFLDSSAEQQQQKVLPSTYKASLRIINHLQKLKSNIKQQIIAQLPEYIKKQCFKVMPYQISEVFQETNCFSCQKNLKELPLPIYVNNKNQFYCNDCEQCLGDDELLVKIKSEELRNKIFMVKCVPIFKKEIQHLKLQNYSSKDQQYEEIVKYTKSIAVNKLNKVIFRQQERNIAHNRLMRDQQKKKFYHDCKERKNANIQHKIHSKKLQKMEKSINIK